MDFTTEANVFEVLRNAKAKAPEDDFLASLYQQINSSTADHSSFGQTTAYDIVSIEIIISCDLLTLNAEKKSHECLVSPYKEKFCNDAQVSYLNDMYKLLYPSLCIVKLSRFYKEYKKCVINGEEYTSLNSRSHRSCAIAAKWRGVTGID